MPWISCLKATDLQRFPQAGPRTPRISHIHPKIRIRWLIGPLSRRPGKF